MSRRFAVLDRDGTIIEERHHLADPDGVALVPGAVEGLKQLRRMGLGVVVVTNQSVVGRGMVDEVGLARIHDRMRALLAERGGEIDAIYHCPHLPDAGCGCRKPEPGLVDRAARDLGFDPGEAFVIGDHAGDMEMGRRVGATTVFVLTGHGREELERVSGDADHVADDLAGAAAIIRDILSKEVV